MATEAQVPKHDTAHGARPAAHKWAVPSSIKAEHEGLHVGLENASRKGGKTGAAAKAVAKLLHPHFLKEEEYALPQLSFLPSIIKGNIPAEADSIIALSEQLKIELPQMMAEHQEVVNALQNLIKAATEEKHTEVVRFAEKLILHAKNEEQVLYPAAILVGEYLKLKQ